jgi:hypothetical protein
MSSFLGRSELPRGLRNNNLGNIRVAKNDWLGKIPVLKNTDGSFEQFKDVPHGIRAMFKLLIGYFENKGIKTIRGIINKYAPPFENNTEAYIQSVAKKTGIPADKELKFLNKKTLIEIGKAIVLIENFGGQYKKYAPLVKAENYEAAFNLLGADEKKKLTTEL